MDDEDLEGVEYLKFAEYLWIEEIYSRLTLEIRQADGQPARLTWPHPDAKHQLTAVAGALVEEFGPTDARGEVQTLLARDDLDIDVLSEALDVLLDLPELAAPEPDHCVVVTRGDRTMVRLAAAVAGPTWILAVDADWTVAVPAADEAPEIFAAAVSAGNRRDRAVLLWRHGDAFGLQIWRRGKMDVTWSWASGWETVVHDSLVVEAAVCKAVTPLNPDIHLPSLRALLRRPSLDEATFESLLELLALPGTVADALNASQEPGSLPGAELIQKATPREATVTAVRSDWRGAGQVRSRPLYLAYAVGTALAAIVCLAMSVLGIAVLVTDGSAVDQAGVSTGDRLLVAAITVLTLVLIPTAIYRLRRARRSRWHVDRS